MVIKRKPLLEKSIFVSLTTRKFRIEKNYDDVIKFEHRNMALYAIFYNIGR